MLQLHSGSLRNYDTEVYRRFGADMGGDIPTRTEFTHNLRPLLNAYGKECAVSIDPVQPGRSRLHP